MAVILLDGTMEGDFPFVQMLRPFGCSLGAGDKSLVVLGFNDEDACLGHDNVVDLGQTIVDRHNNVMDEGVVFGAQRSQRRADG